MSIRRKFTYNTIYFESINKRALLKYDNFYFKIVNNFKKQRFKILYSQFISKLIIQKINFLQMVKST